MKNLSFNIVISTTQFCQFKPDSQNSIFMRGGDQLKATDQRGIGDMWTNTWTGIVITDCDDPNLVTGTFR